MTPTAKLVSILTENVNELPGLEENNIFAFMIDPDRMTVDEPFVVVSEIPAGGHVFSNGTPISTSRRVQLEIYYPPNTEVDMQGLEDKIKAFLLSKNFYCYRDAGHVLTPDSENITNTLKFNYIERT